MESYDILDKARNMTRPTAKEVAMLLTTLDPDEPYTLKWDIKLEIPEWVALNGNSGNYVFDFLLNFNSYLLDVKISDPK